MTIRLQGATSGFVELDAPAVADGQRYELPGDVGIPAGAVMQFAGNVAPAGWRKANGEEISRTAYPRLWAWAQASGNLAASEGAKQAGQFGPGNGSTTFTIPDLRGEFVRGWDDGRGVDTGRVLGSAQADDLKSHYHTGAIGSYSLASNSPLQNVSCASSSTNTGPTGGAETRPRNVALLYCIKV